jgi:flagella basal body P-ring formation protein FlgA
MENRVNAWKRKQQHLALGMLACLGLSTPSFAKDGEGAISPEALVAAAKNHVEAVMRVPEGARLAVAFAPPDSRLALRPCDAPLEANAAWLRDAGGPISVQVSCQAPRWSLYLQGEAKVTAEVWVAARDLPRGTQLTAADLEVRSKTLHQLSAGYALASTSLEGRQLRQSFSRGTVVAPRATAAPVWVRTGEPITLAAGTGPLAVRMAGTALTNGSANDTVRVRNKRSSRVLQGRVIGPGEVQIGF